MRDSLSLVISRKYRFIEYTITMTEIIILIMYNVSNHNVIMSNHITVISWRHLLATCIKIFLGNMLFIMLCRTA